MASSAGTVQYVIDQSGLGSALTFRKMFGEYALYLGGKVVAFVCDDTLYLKPTDAARELLPRVNEGCPYPGAKLHFLLADELDDRALLQRLFTVTAAALPMPAPKPKRSATPAKGRPSRR
jgi:TfoX/Sxy family transcriptional regulator of competence genes